VAEDSLAEYSETGTETSPNEMVALPIDRGGMETHIRRKYEARKVKGPKIGWIYLRGTYLLRPVGN
jgi:hypothetical protein